VTRIVMQHQMDGWIIAPFLTNVWFLQVSVAAVFRKMSWTSCI